MILHYISNNTYDGKTKNVASVIVLPITNVAGCQFRWIVKSVEWIYPPHSLIGTGNWYWQHLHIGNIITLATLSHWQHFTSITWTPRIVKIRERIKSEFDNSCMASSFMSYKILVRKRLNYIIFAPIIIGGWILSCGFQKQNFCGEQKRNGFSVRTK